MGRDESHRTTRVRMDVDGYPRRDRLNKAGCKG
jgi:hypothetical protein